MDIFSLECNNQLKITTPRIDAESVYRYYRIMCDNLFDKKTEWLFGPLVSKYNGNPSLCLAYLSQLFFDAVKEGWFNDFDKYKELERQISDYDEGFKIGYLNFENKFKIRPTDQRKEVFSEIINFPSGQSLKPYKCYVKVVILNSSLELKRFGELIGRYFYAWTIVLDSQVHFEPMFKKHLQSIEKDSINSEKLKNNSIPHQTEMGQKYTIDNNSLLNKVYKHCNSVIFECTYPEFLQYVEGASFKNLNVKTKTKVQDLVYRLSGAIGDSWYDDVCKNTNWTKSVCSGQSEKYKDTPWTKQLDRILPRPIGRNIKQ